MKGRSVIYNIALMAVPGRRELHPVESAGVGALSGIIEVLLQQPSVSIKNSIQVINDEPRLHLVINDEPRLHLRIWIFEVPLSESQSISHQVMIPIGLS